ncbi:hypothetical protein HMPREF1557_01568 [Streptococcus sobrinus W1703]|uniref:Uncharacterized protein n=1 Tax=Streptococcus sobrinus W1703 TaxID=1227275 RepID=U2J441_9STRE|nr:hypothetical protein HMPREF1557_01568 [Streptococcus sobrinus W1703]
MLVFYFCQGMARQISGLKLFFRALALLLTLIFDIIITTKKLKYF